MFLDAVPTLDDGVPLPPSIQPRSGGGEKMHDKNLTKAFIALQLFGWAGFTLILWTVFLSKKIKRHPVWINFCLTWMISCVSYVLLFLAGDEDRIAEGDVSSKTLCLVQASLIYAAPTMTASSTLALIIHTWFSVRSVLSNVEPKHPILKDTILLVMPYAFEIVFFVVTLSYGIVHPDDQVQLAECWMYCDFKSDVPGNVSFSIVSGLLCLGIGVEIAITSILYQKYREYTSRTPMHAIAIVVRLVLFTAFACMTIVMGFLYVDKKKHGANFSVLLGFLPAIAVIVFGSQLDIFYTWFFCLPKPIADECRYKNLATRPLHLRGGSSTSTLDSPTIRPSKEPKYYHHADSQGKKMAGADEEMAFDSRWGSSVMMLGADISDNRIRGGGDDVSPSKRSFIVAAVNSLGIPPPPHDRPRRHRGWVDASGGGGSYDRLPSTDSNDTFYKPPSRHKTV